MHGIYLVKKNALKRPLENKRAFPPGSHHAQDVLVIEHKSQGSDLTDLRVCNSEDLGLEAHCITAIYSEKF